MTFDFYFVKSSLKLLPIYDNNTDYGDLGEVLVDSVDDTNMFLFSDFLKNLYKTNKVRDKFFRLTTDDLNDFIAKHSEAFNQDTLLKLSNVVSSANSKQAYIYTELV